MSSPVISSELLKTPLYELHLELGAKMVPFAGYQMPVQYPAGLMHEHRHTRQAAGLFDVSHMGQVSLSGPGAAHALERLVPADIVGLGSNQQRYGLLMQPDGGLMDDLMMVNRDLVGGGDLLVIVNGACKSNDIAHIKTQIGRECTVNVLDDYALLALQGPLAGAALARLCDAPSRLVFMQGGFFELLGAPCYITRSGYTGEDGFEISVPNRHVESLARHLLAQPEVMPIGLGARNSLRLEAGLCLYGNDLGPATNPVYANLRWAIPKVRRKGGARHGGYLGSSAVDAAFAVIESNTESSKLAKMRVGLVGLERIPVREPAQLEDAHGHPIGQVCSGLLSPTLDQPLAMAYLPLALTQPGTEVFARVRDKRVPMRVTPMPFLPARYVRQVP